MGWHGHQSARVTSARGPDPCSLPECGHSFLGEIGASCQHDFQRAKSAHVMTTELWILLDPAKQSAEVKQALARRQMLFVAPVAIGEPDRLATGQPHLVQEAVDASRDQGRMIDRKGPA